MPTIPIIKFAIAYYNSCNFHYRTGRQHSLIKVTPLLLTRRGVGESAERGDLHELWK